MAGALAAIGTFVVLWQMPAYTSSGTFGTTRETLAEVNGQWVLVLAAISVVVAAVAWVGLHLTCSRGSRAGHAVAGIAVGLIGFLALLGAASIGIFLVRAAALLGVAMLTSPTGQPARSACGV